jgi:competence protein ComEA
MKLKIAVFLIILILAGNVLKIFINDSIRIKVEIDESGLILKESENDLSSQKIDINKADYETFISAGFSKSQAEKISAYKDFAGEVVLLKELAGIKGFGKAGIEKAEKILYVSYGEKIRKKHNINKLDENKLKLTGFTNKEIKKILSEARKNKIRSNIELIDIIGTERYTEVENRIKYND